MAVDFDKLAEELGLDKEDYLEVLEIYLETTPEDLNRAGDALSGGNARSLAEAAHSIKGASGNMGLMGLYDKAKELEFAAKGGDLDAARKLFEELLEEFNSLKAEVAEAL